MAKRKSTPAAGAGELLTHELAGPERTALTGDAGRRGESVFYTDPDGGRLEATIVTLYDDGAADLVVLTPGARGATEESQHPAVEQGGEGQANTWYEREPE